MNILSLIGRDNELFKTDINSFDPEVRRIVEASSFLVIGGTGSIGQAVVTEIFARDPRLGHTS